MEDERRRDASSSSSDGFLFLPLERITRNCCEILTQLGLLLFGDTGEFQADSKPRPRIGDNGVPWRSGMGISMNHPPILKSAIATMIGAPGPSGRSSAEAVQRSRGDVR